MSSKVVDKKSDRHPSDNKFLCWDSEPNRFIDIGSGDDELLNVVFTDSNFETNHERGGLDIYALVSTLESLYTESKFMRAQDAFGLGDFRIEISVREQGGNYCNARFMLHVDKPDKPFSLTLNSYSSSRNLANSIRRPLIGAYNRIKRKFSGV